MATNDEIAQIFSVMVERFVPEKAEGVDALIQFNLSGDNGGLYWVKIANGKCEYGEGAVESPKMTLKASADDWAAVARGDLNPMHAFMSGKIKVEGEMGLALKLQPIFGM